MFYTILQYWVIKRLGEQWIHNLGGEGEGLGKTLRLWNVYGSENVGLIQVELHVATWTALASSSPLLPLLTSTTTSFVSCVSTVRTPYSTAMLTCTQCQHWQCLHCYRLVNGFDLGLRVQQREVGIKAHKRSSGPNSRSTRNSITPGRVSVRKHCHTLLKVREC